MFWLGSKAAAGFSVYFPFHWHCVQHMACFFWIAGRTRPNLISLNLFLEPVRQLKKVNKRCLRSNKLRCWVCLCKFACGSILCVSSLSMSVFISICFFLSYYRSLHPLSTNFCQNNVPLVVCVSYGFILSRGFCTCDAVADHSLSSWTVTSQTPQSPSLPTTPFTRLTVPTTKDIDPNTRQGQTGLLPTTQGGRLIYRESRWP